MPEVPLMFPNEVAEQEKVKDAVRFGIEVHEMCFLKMQLS
jgi:hypothetical protein